MALAIYDNDYTAKVRSKLLEIIPGNYDKYEKYVSPERNILKRISSLSSVMYQRPPWRRANNKQAVDLVNEYCTQINRKLAQAESMTHAIGDMFIMPYWDDMRKRVDYELISPDAVEVSVKRSSIEWIQVTQVIDDKKVLHRYYSDGTVKQLNKNDKWVEIDSIFKGKNVNPVVWLSLRAPTEHYPWAIGEVRDLVNATIGAAIQETYRNRGHFLRSQRIPNLRDPAALAEAGRNASADNSLPTDQDTILVGDFSALSLSDEDDKFLESIRADIADAAASRGISQQNYNRTFTNTNQLNAVSEELRIRWRQNRILFADAEKDLLKCSLILINKYTPENVDIDTKWTIEYLEPLPAVDDPQKALKVLDDGIQMGTDNAVAFLMRNNPDINTEKEAIDYIEKNIEIRAKMVEQMRELNAPADPKDAGQTPEQNGASGPLVVSAPIDPNSNRNTQESNNVRE